MSETIQKKIKLFPLYMGTSGCDYHRIRLPYIFAHQWVDDDAYQGFELKDMLKYFAISEIVVLNRVFPIGVEKLAEYKNKYGFKVAVDLDDWWVLPDYHPNYREYKTRAAAQIIGTLQLADVVTVTTDRLYQRVKDYHKNVHVIPNCLPHGQRQFISQPAKHRSDFNFIYTGQSSHLEDVRIMQADIKRASKLAGVSFTLAGYKAGGPAGKVWHGIEQVLNQGAPYHRIPAQPLDSYMDVYNESDCSLVPLCINDFNSCKSNLKILEAACKKIPAIVSHVPPYRDDTDAPVMWVKQPGDWFKHIITASNNPDVARELGEELHQWASEKYNFFKWNKVRFELYQHTVQ